VLEGWEARFSAGAFFATRLGTVRSISKAAIRIRAVDWAVLALLAFEVPSLWFSQDRANSVGAAEVVALSVAVYFALRWLIRASLPAAWLAALVGLGGVGLASFGIWAGGPVKNCEETR